MILIDDMVSLLIMQRKSPTCIAILNLLSCFFCPICCQGCIHLSVLLFYGSRALRELVQVAFYTTTRPHITAHANIQLHSQLIAMVAVYAGIQCIFPSYCGLIICKPCDNYAGIRKAIVRSLQYEDANPMLSLMRLFQSSVDLRAHQ